MVQLIEALQVCGLQKEAMTTRVQGENLPVFATNTAFYIECSSRSAFSK